MIRRSVGRRIACLCGPVLRGQCTPSETGDYACWLGQNLDQQCGGRTDTAECGPCCAWGGEGAFGKSACPRAWHWQQNGGSTLCADRLECLPVQLYQNWCVCACGWRVWERTGWSSAHTPSGLARANAVFWWRLSALEIGAASREDWFVALCCFHCAFIHNRNIECPLHFCQRRKQSPYISSILDLSRFLETSHLFIHQYQSIKQDFLGAIDRQTEIRLWWYL